PVSTSSSLAHSGTRRSSSGGRDVQGADGRPRAFRRGGAGRDARLRDSCIRHHASYNAPSAWATSASATTSGGCLLADGGRGGGVHRSRGAGGGPLAAR